MSDDVQIEGEGADRPGRSVRDRALALQPTLVLWLNLCVNVLQPRGTGWHTVLVAVAATGFFAWWTGRADRRRRDG